MPAAQTGSQLEAMEVEIAGKQGSWGSVLTYVQKRLQQEAGGRTW